MKGCGTLVGLSAMVILLAGPFIGASLMIDLRGLDAGGEVRAKHETIDVRYGRWWRTTSIEVVYQPADQSFPELTSIDVDPPTYDQLQAGASVALRYQSNRTLRSIFILPTARLASQSTLTTAKARLPENAGLIGLLALGGLLALLAWRSWRIRGSGWLLLAYLVAAGLYVMVSASGATPDGPRATAGATVRALHETRWRTKARSGNTSKALVSDPFDVVELEFVPEGMGEPVVAVDEIDPASAQTLEQGGQAQISYSIANPRDAQIIGATRPSYLRYLARVGIFGLALFACLMGWFLIQVLFGRATTTMRPNNRRGGSHLP